MGLGTARAAVQFWELWDAFLWVGSVEDVTRPVLSVPGLLNAWRHIFHTLFLSPNQCLMYFTYLQRHLPFHKPVHHRLTGWSEPLASYFIFFILCICYLKGPSRVDTEPQTRGVCRCSAWVPAWTWMWLWWMKPSPDHALKMRPVVQRDPSRCQKCGREHWCWQNPAVALPCDLGMREKLTPWTATEN